MRELMTVLGPIAPEDLGFCQFHEHLALCKGRSWELDHNLLIDDEDKSVREVRRFLRAGGRTIVEAQPGGCGRISPMLVSIARRTGVHLIASTGFHKLRFYREGHWIFSRSREELAQCFTRELQQGMFTDAEDFFCRTQSTARAGIIKTALDSCGLTPDYRRLFLAAADAALATDRTLMIHIEKGSDPVELLAFLQDAGLDPHHLVFCHLDRACPDLATHLAVLDQGAYLEFDTIGRFKYHDDVTEAGLFRRLIDAGFEDQLLFSLDTTRARLKAYTPDAVGLDYLLCSFLDQLRAQGVTQAQIDKFSHTNPLGALL